MVLEALISPIEAEKRPWQLFFLGALFCLVAMFLSNWIFNEQASLVLVFFIVMASFPIIYNTIKLEEQKDESMDVKEFVLIKEHAKALSVFLFLFLGITVVCAVVYSLFPADFVSNTFSVQQAAIQAINHKVSGNFFNTETLSIIFFNNLKVLVFCILFAFIFGAGAIFILTWNATVIGVAIGDFVRQRLAGIALDLGFTNTAHYLGALSLGVLRYMTHGIFEILAYFIAGLAGGIISICLIHHGFKTKRFERIILDTGGLILLSLFVLFVAAFVEVFITPMFF